MKTGTAGLKKDEKRSTGICKTAGTKLGDGNETELISKFISNLRRHENSSIGFL